MTRVEGAGRGNIADNIRNKREATQGGLVGIKKSWLFFCGEHNIMYSC